MISEKHYLAVKKVKNKMKGGVFALGNFDGVHLGHRAAIDATVQKAKQTKMLARVLTFEPHPRAFFQPTLPPFRLTPPPAKARLLKSLGIDDVVEIPFTSEIAEMTAEQFVEDILVSRLGAEKLVAGRDFAFGRKRSGNMQKLSRMLTPRGIEVTEIEELGNDGEVFSSTRVRELLLEGQPEAAAKILGRPWQIEGTVYKGKNLGGHTLGFRTANIFLGDYLRPKFGVYTIRAGKAGEALTYRGVANIGLRPTILTPDDAAAPQTEKKENLEAFLFDFDKDIYGQDWQFALTRFLRPERKFDSFDALKTQIEKDVIEAKRIQ